MARPRWPAAALCLSVFLAAPATAAELADLGWLAGCWSSEAPGGRRTEECWLAPAGGLMLGVHRDLRPGRRTSFEALRIVAADGGIAYLASPGGRPSTAFPLVESTDRSAVFANPEHDWPTRISYRLDEDDVLHVRAEGPGAGGEASALEWTWTRDHGGAFPAPSASPAEDAVPPTGGPLPAAVRERLVGYYDDLSDRDWDAFRTHFWERATITTRWQPPGEDAVRVVVSTVDEFVAKAPEGPGSQPIFEERMTSLTGTARGDLAVAWAGYRARFGAPGDVQEWTGTDVFTLLRHDGRWRIVSLTFAPE